ncbi:MAG: MFS transporter [Leucobacter sp.]
MMSSVELTRSRRTTIAVNVAKALLLAALTPPIVAGIAQRATALGSGMDAAAVVTFTATAGALCAVIGAAGLGALSDLGRPTAFTRWGWVLLGTIVGTVGLIVLSFGDFPLALTVGWGAAQLGYSGAMAVLRVILASAVPSHRRRGAVAAVLAAYVGMLIPLLILLVLPGRLWETTFSLAALSLLVPIIFLVGARSMPEHHDPDVEGTATEAAPDVPGSQRVSRTALLVVQAAANIVMAAFLSYHPLDLAERADADEGFPVRASVWVLIAAVAGLMFASTLLMRRPELLANGQRVLVMGGGILSLSLIIRAVSEPLPLIALAAMLSGVAVGMNSSALLALALETGTPERRGKFIGMYSAAGALGQLVGPVVALGVLGVTASLAPGAGYRWVFLVLAAVPLLWATILALQSRRSRAYAVGA